MGKIRAVVLAVVGASGMLGVTGCSHPQSVAYFPPPPPPPPVTEATVYAQGRQDGFEAARHDVATGQPPTLEHHPRFRQPPVPPPAWEDYRRAFRAGYGEFLHGGGGAPPPPPPAP